MINNISSALDAYQTALSRIGAKMPAEQPKAVPASNFGDMVKSSFDKAVELSKKSEAVTIAGIQGKADVQDVVLAVSNAEMALDTVVAFRDTAVKAYQSIIKMQI